MLVVCLVLFILAPVLSVPLSLFLLLKDPFSYQAKYFVCLFAAGVGIYAYHIVPDMEMDLFRYYFRMEQMGEIDNWELLKEEIAGFNTEFLSYYIMYLISKTKLYGLYPFLSVFYTYTVCMIIALEVAKTRHYLVSQCRLLLIVLLTWLASDAIASGIRYNMAYTTFLLAIYFDYLKNKNRIITYLLYIASFFIHSSFILFVFLRLLLPIMKVNKFLRYILFLVFCTWSLYFDFFASFAANLSFYKDGYIADKFESYNQILTGGRLGKYIILYSKLLICSLISYVLIRKYNKRSTDIVLLNVSNSMLVVGAFNRSIYVSRFFQVLASFTPFFLKDILEEFQHKKLLMRIFLGIISFFFFYDQISFFGMSLDQDLFSICFTPIFLTF